MTRAMTPTIRRGNTLIETALVLSLVLCPLVFWTMDLTYVFFVKNALQAAAREGARAAIVSSATVADVDAAITRMMNASGLSQSKAKWTRTITNAATGATVGNLASLGDGDSVQVKISCVWSNVQLTPSYLNLVKGTMVLNGQTAMRVEGGS